MIQAQSADGVIHQFPDGTDPAVVDRAMKDYVANKPSTGKDVAKGYASGLTGGVMNLAETALQATPLGSVKNALAVATGRPFDLLGGVRSITSVIAPTLNRLAGYQPQTDAGQVAKTVGEMTPNAAAPGRLAVRAVNVLAPTIGTEVAGRTAQAMGASAPVVQAARAVGGLAGAGAGSLRVAPRSAGASGPANLLASRARINPQAMQDKANALADAGVQPTLIDVAGDRGRRLIRAVGVKNDVAGETLAANARTVSATAKPAVMARTQDLGPMKGTTADELTTKLEDARDNAATENYAAPYETPVQITDEIKAGLADTPGRAALQRALNAAVARQDSAQAAEIQGLLRAGSPMPTPPSRLDGLKSVKTSATIAPSEPQTYPWPDSVSGATLDRIQIALGAKARQLKRNNGGDIASGLTGRQGQINGALDNTPGLTEARSDFRAKSQAIDVLGKGRQDVFSTDPADYGRWLETLSPEARDANKVAIRQEILDTLGGQRSSTMGSIDELASSEYAKANLRQALGAEADPYLEHLNARLEQVRNARMVDPNGGSRTEVLRGDVANVAGKALDVGKSVVRGDAWGVVGKLGQWFLSRGVSDADAQALAQAAVDPVRSAQIMQQVSQRYGLRQAREFIALRNAAVSGALALGSQARAAQQPQE